MRRSIPDPSTPLAIRLSDRVDGLITGWLEAFGAFRRRPSRYPRIGPCIHDPTGWDAFWRPEPEEVPNFFRLVIGLRASPEATCCSRVGPCCTPVARNKRGAYAISEDRWAWLGTFVTGINRSGDGVSALALSPRPFLPALPRQGADKSARSVEGRHRSVRDKGPFVLFLPRGSARALRSGRSAP